MRGSGAPGAAQRAPRTAGLREQTVVTDAEAAGPRGARGAGCVSLFNAEPIASHCSSRTVRCLNAMTEHARPLVTRPSPPAPPLGPALPSRVLPLEGTVPVTLDTRAAAPRLRPRLTRPAHAVRPGPCGSARGLGGRSEGNCKRSVGTFKSGAKAFLLHNVQFWLPYKECGCGTDVNTAPRQGGSMAGTSTCPRHT